MISCYCFRWHLILIKLLLGFFQYYFAMLLIFLVLLVGAVLAFVFQDKFGQRFTSLLKDNLIITYQDDPDKQSTIDWLQEQVSILYQKKNILCKNFIVWFCSCVSNCGFINIDKYWMPNFFINLTLEKKSKIFNFSRST